MLLILDVELTILQKKCNVLEINPHILQLPSTNMDPIHIIYRNMRDSRTVDVDQAAQWHLDSVRNPTPSIDRGLKLLWTPTLDKILPYYMLLGPNIQDDETIATYAEVIDAKVKEHGVGLGAQCIATVQLPEFDKTSDSNNDKSDIIAKSHTELKKDIETAIEKCKVINAAGRLVIMVLSGSRAAVYAAFKDTADRKNGLQVLCITKEQITGEDANDLGLRALCITKGNNTGKDADDLGLQRSFSSFTMRMNLKLGGSNHTLADFPNGTGRISELLQPRNYNGRGPIMILGAAISFSILRILQINANMTRIFRSQIPKVNR